MVGFTITTSGMGYCQEERQMFVRWEERSQWENEDSNLRSERKGETVETFEFVDGGGIIWRKGRLRKAHCAGMLGRWGLSDAGEHTSSGPKSRVN